ncbi:hypothetical protein ACSNOD_21335, partial [Streptomyces sp. URMC 123]
DAAGRGDAADEAMATAQEAVAILRRLGRRQPEAHGHFLAEALGAQSTVLMALRRYGDAIAAADECAAVRRRMAEADPGITPRLAHALLNAVGVRAEAGGPRLAAAVRLFAEATGVCERREARAVPGIAGLHRAVGSRLADRLAAEGRPEDAERVRHAVERHGASGPGTGTDARTGTRTGSAEGPDSGEGSWRDAATFG